MRVRRGGAVEAHPPRAPSPRALGCVGPGEEVPDELAEQPLASLEAHKVRVVADEVLAQIIRVGEEHLSVVPEVVEVVVAESPPAPGGPGAASPGPKRTAKELLVGRAARCKRP